MLVRKANIIQRLSDPICNQGGFIQKDIRKIKKKIKKKNKKKNKDAHQEVKYYPEALRSNMQPGGDLCWVLRYFDKLVRKSY